MRGWICGSSRTKITKNSKKNPSSYIFLLLLGNILLKLPTPITRNVHFSYPSHITSSLFISSFSIIWFYTHHGGKGGKKSERQRKYPTLEVVVCVAAWWMYLGLTIKKISFCLLHFFGNLRTSRFVSMTKTFFLKRLNFFFVLLL